MADTIPVDVVQPQASQPMFTMPLISLNPSTTFQSPFFWLFVGAAGSITIYYLVKKGKL